MPRQLTQDQLRIVRTLDTPLFVAAGAGSGKSSTLAERVAWALTPGSGEGGAPFLSSLDQVLVITFTHAAADEIREKIRERLHEGGMREQALAVDSAWISTIHGMCSRILRRHAFELGLDPAFSVLGTHTAEQLVERATDEVMREVQADPSFHALLEVFRPRSQGGGDAASTVFGMVRAVRDAAGSAVGGFDAVRFPGQAPDVRGTVARLRDDTARALALGRQEGAFASGKGAAEEARLEAALPALEALLALPPARLAAEAPAVLAQVGKPGDAYRKKAMREVGADLRAAYADAQLEVAFLPVAPLRADILRIARRVDERYAQLKAEAGALDNDDLLSRAFEAFRTHPGIAAEYGSRFRLVMVDEFQDTNAQQVRMIELLSGPGACHLATVGDAQQSIYRFRAADVQVFRDREVASADDVRVRLTMNFRSHADVLSFVERALAGPPLPDFMRLDPCPTRPDGLRARALPRVDVEVVSTKARGGAPAPVRAQVMAALIADRVRERLDAGERAEDVALLLGRMRYLDTYLSALRGRGIDCVVSGGSTFSAAPEVRMVEALARVMANPKDTQAGLFPVLVSGLFSLEADDLCLLATKVQEANGAFARRGIDVGLLGMELPGGAEASPRLVAAHEVLTRALGRLGSWRLADVLRAVLAESGWAARCQAAGAAGKARLANALAAVRHVGELAEEGGLGPARAAEEFGRWLALSKEGPAALSGGGGGAVKVMTVHASKGLEFPLVAIAECWGSAQAGSVVGVTCENRGGLVDAALVPEDVTAAMLGEPPERVDERSSTLDWARHLVAAAREGDLAEEARLLYVAITRARESVILGVQVQRGSKGLAPHLAEGVVGTLLGGELPPVGESVLDYGGSAPARVRHVSLAREADMVSVEPAELAPVLGGAECEEGSEGEGPAAQPFPTFEARPGDVPAEVLAATAPVPSATRAGVYSYSSAHAQMLAAWGGGDPSDGEMVLPVAEAAPAVPEDEDIDAPAGTADADKATSLGSAFHELAQAMVEGGTDVDAARLDALARQWGLSARLRARLEEAAARWERSDIRREALSHGLVRAEVPFFMRVESAYGTHVEGAIDLLCTDAGSDAALVVDYKTGDAGLPEDEVRARHEMQANFYASVLMAQGWHRVTCAFVCVERDRGDGQPLSVRYEFDAARPPRI